MTTKLKGVVNRLIAVAACIPHGRNYNRHSAQQLADLRESLRQFGQVRSIVVQPSGKGYRLVAGHGLWQAAKAEGLTELRADVIPASWSEHKVLAYLATDNETARHSDPDQAQLDAIVKELYDAEGEALARLAAGEQQALDRILAGEQQPDNAPVDFKAQWMVLIECATETEQVDLLQRFLDEGLKCRALVS